MDRLVSSCIRFGPFEVSPDSGELRKNGRRLKLSGQAVQVLVILIENPGQVVAREELQKKLWPGASFGDFDHGLNAAVNRLREVLGDSATEPTYIETLPRRGYRFIVPVCGTAVSGDALPTKPINAPEGIQAGDIVPLPSVQPIRYAVRRLGWSAALALVIALLVLAYWLFIARPPIRSVAVLPFSTSSKETEYLGDGISDSLIDSVSQLSELKVISHASAFHYK